MLVKLRSISEKVATSSLGIHTEMHRLGFNIDSDDLPKYQALKASLENQPIYKDPLFNNYILEVLAKADQNFPIPSTKEDSLKLFSEALKTLKSKKESFKAFTNIKFNSAPLPLKDAIYVLKELKDPNYLDPEIYSEFITMNDYSVRNIFINLGRNSNNSNIEYDVLYLKAVLGVESTFRKNFINEKIMEIIKNITVKNQGEIITKENFIPLFRLISTIKEIDERNIIDLKKLQNNLNDILPEDCSFLTDKSDLCDLFFSLNPDSTKSDAFRGITKDIVKVIDEISYKKVFEIVIKMDKMNMKIPFKVILKCEEITIDMLKKFKIQKILEISLCFTKQKIFSVDFLQKICI